MPVSTKGQEEAPPGLHTLPLGCVTNIMRKLESVRDRVHFMRAAACVYRLTRGNLAERGILGSFVLSIPARRKWVALPNQTLRFGLSLKSEGSLQEITTALQRLKELAGFLRVHAHAFSSIQVEGTAAPDFLYCDLYPPLLAVLNATEWQGRLVLNAKVSDADAIEEHDERSLVAQLQPLFLHPQLSLQLTVPSLPALRRIAPGLVQCRALHLRLPLLDEEAGFAGVHPLPNCARLTLDPREECPTPCLQDLAAAFPDLREIVFHECLLQAGEVYSRLPPNLSVLDLSFTIDPDTYSALPLLARSCPFLSTLKLNLAGVDLADAPRIPPVRFERLKRLHLQCGGFDSAGNGPVFASLLPYSVLRDALLRFFAVLDAPLLSEIEVRYFTGPAEEDEPLADKHLYAPFDDLARFTALSKLHFIHTRCLDYSAFEEIASHNLECFVRLRGDLRALTALQDVVFSATILIPLGMETQSTFVDLKGAFDDLQLPEHVRRPPVSYRPQEVLDDKLVWETQLVWRA